MSEHNDVVCPFCGLLCDDLSIESDAQGLRVVAAGCAVANRCYSEIGLASDAVNARIKGHEVTLDEAIEHAAKLLNKANNVLISGLATDVNGVRQALRLADHCAALIDHANSSALLKNSRILQTSGWLTTTFSEVRNRSDLLILLGDQLFERFPRLLERLIAPPQSLFAERLQRREVVLIGPLHSDSDQLADALGDVDMIGVELSEIAEVLAAMRALLAQRPLQCDTVAGVPLATLRALVKRLRKAQYSTLIWSAADLAFAHSELCIEQINELIRALNHSTRSAGLPLAGSQADITANQVCTWQTGYPLPVSFSKAYPQFDPLLYQTEHYLASGACDALLWIAALSPELLPPRSDLPTIVLAHPAMQFAHPPEVSISVAVPGVDHSGHLYRGDTVVSLPLPRLRQSTLPAVSQVLQTIYDRIEAD